VSESFDDRRKALEEEYFRRKEHEDLEKLRASLDAEAGGAGASQTGEAEAGAGLKAVRCPKCDGTLSEVTHDNVRIDRCDKCQGVWLDAGELEQLTKHEDSGGWLSRLWPGSSGE
jgi:hypothetical protein